MNYVHPVTINIKTEKQTKEQAQDIARDLGMNLSSIINAYLKQFIRTRSVAFRMEDEEPSEWLVEAIRRADEDIKAGRASPVFTSAEEAIKWLDEQV